jgi:hypothetical protein
MIVVCGGRGETNSLEERERMLSLWWICYTRGGGSGWGI